jgi:hypothetical protein
MIVSPQEKILPKFEEVELVDLSAKALQVSGELLQDKVADVISSVSVRGRGDRVYFDADQRQSLWVYRFDAHRTVEVNVGTKESSGELDYQRRTSNPDGDFRDRLTFDDDRQPILVKEKSMGRHKDPGNIALYDPLEKTPASLKIAASLLDTLITEADELPRQKKPETSLPTSGFDERFCLRPARVVPLIGQLAIVASELILARDDTSHMHVQMQIAAFSQGRIYGSGDLFDRVSNRLSFSGFNAITNQRAEFNFSVEPVGHDELAFLEANLITRSPDTGSLATNTKREAVKGGSKSLRREIKHWSSGDRNAQILGNYPASLNIVREMANRGAQTILGQDTELDY